MRGCLVGLLFVAVSALAGDEATMDSLSTALGISSQWTQPFASNYASWSGVLASSGPTGLAVTSISLKGLNLKVNFPESLFDLLTNLVSLDLSGNDFKGCGFSSLAPYTSLKSLVLSNWKGKNGNSNCSIPPFRTLPAFESFEAKNANLNGSLFSSTWLCTRLQTLILDVNQLSGDVPWSSLTNVTTFVTIGLARNSFNTHPFSALQALNNSRALQELHVDTISGTLPDGVALAALNLNLQRLDFSAVNNSGQLSGNWPTLSLFGPLTSIDFSGNPQFGRRFPNNKQLCALNVTLMSMNFSLVNAQGDSFNLCGIPFPRLVTFDISSMNLSDSYPNMKRQPNLKVMHLGGNNFTGPLPKSWGGLVLTELDLSDMLTPVYLPLPPEFAAIATLKRLNMHNCGLIGVLPNFLLTIPSVDLTSNPGLQNCSAAGSIRVCGNLTNIKLDSGVCLDVCPPLSGCPLPPPTVPPLSPLPVCNGSTWLIGNVVNDGSSVIFINTSAPLEVIQDYDQGPDGVLQINVGSTDLAALVVNGDATLDGTVFVTLNLPLNGETLIPLILSGNFSGNLSTVVSGPCIASYQPTVTSSGLYVLVIPDTTSKGCKRSRNGSGLTVGQKIAIGVSCSIVFIALIVVGVLVLLKMTGKGGGIFAAHQSSRENQWIR